MAVLVALVVSLLALLVSFFTSFKILSFNSFIEFPLPLRAASIRFGSFVTFCDVLSMFILRYKEKKLKQNMDPIFEHPVFDSARERVKYVIRQLEKPQ